MPMAWPAILAWHETERLYVLEVGASMRMFFVLPKRGAAGEVSRVRELLERCVEPSDIPGEPTKPKPNRARLTLALWALLVLMFTAIYFLVQK